VVCDCALQLQKHIAAHRLRWPGADTPPTTINELHLKESCETLVDALTAGHPLPAELASTPREPAGLAYQLLRELPEPAAATAPAAPAAQEPPAAAAAAVTTTTSSSSSSQSAAVLGMQGPTGYAAVHQDGEYVLSGLHKSAAMGGGDEAAAAAEEAKGKAEDARAALPLASQQQLAAWAQRVVQAVDAGGWPADGTSYLRIDKNKLQGIELPPFAVQARLNVRSMVDQYPGPTPYTMQCCV